MFLTMFLKTQNIGQTMHLTMLIAHPYMLGVLPFVEEPDLLVSAACATSGTLQSKYLKHVVMSKIKKFKSNLMIIYWISNIVLIVVMACRGSSRSITTRVSQLARSSFRYLQAGGATE